ncbi:hypothetical protein Tco_1395865 [Tanacetum coccineum]
MNQNYFEPNPSYNPNYSGFDRPPQYPIDQSPLQEMSIQEMEDLKQHYLDEMLSLSNDLQIKDYRNEKIDIRFRRKCESMIDELKGKFNGMSIEINKKKELQHLEQSTIPLNAIYSQIPPSNAITLVLPTIEPKDSLSMGDEHLRTIPEMESDEVIKSSVENLVLIPSKSEDTSESDSDCDLPSCDDFSPINVSKEKSVTFSNPLFDSNDDFTSSDDESLSDEDDECFNPGVILEGFTDEPPLEENGDLFDLESKMNEWKKILYDAPINDLMTKDKIFDLGGDIDEIDALLDIDISMDIEDGYHDSEGDIIYLESLLFDDTIPNLPPKVFLNHDTRSLSDINDLKIMVKDCPDYEDSRARAFVHRSLDLQSLACLFMGI